ncbi:DUF6191 domain-containing protein [Streptomyces sp. NPDC039028]|uniref:DUF6191 domain-containing protein n=1 Tax=unclassified Streptomyces TaxID=2593676 RepID=UPI0033DC5DFF
MTVFDPLAELFAPGRRHTAEERRRQALTREDPGDADPSRGPVDLASGRVTIRAPRRPTAGEAAQGAGAAADTAESGGPGGSEGCGEEVEAVGQGGGLAPA